MAEEGQNGWRTFYPQTPLKKNPQKVKSLLLAKAV